MQTYVTGLIQLAHIYSKSFSKTVLFSFPKEYPTRMHRNSHFRGGAMMSDISYSLNASVPGVTVRLPSLYLAWRGLGVSQRTFMIGIILQ